MRWGCVVAMLASTCCTPQQRLAASELQWTAVTLARDGAVGKAVHSSRAKAVALAIADCKQATRWSNDCGSLLVTMQEGWAIALLCGTSNILVAARTLAEAEAKASRRKGILRANHGTAMPACISIATIDSAGMSQ